MQVDTDEPEIIERVAALDVGKAEVVCCARVPGPGGQRMQVELLDPKKWNARLELANAMFEYLEIWHNRQRRHSRLGMLTPIVLDLPCRGAPLRRENGARPPVDVVLTWSIEAVP